MKNVPPCNTVQGNCRIPSIRWNTDETSDRENLSLARTHDELMRSNTDLTEKAARLRDAIVQDGQAVVELEQRIDTLRRIKEGLEIAVENKPAEEVPYLSQPLFSLGIQPSAQNHLTAYGLRYVGDLVRRDEQYLMEIWGNRSGNRRADKDQTERERRMS